MSNKYKNKYISDISQIDMPRDKEIHCANNNLNCSEIISNQSNFNKKISHQERVGLNEGKNMNINKYKKKLLYTKKIIGESDKERNAAPTRVQRYNSTSIIISNENNDKNYYNTKRNTRYENLDPSKVSINIDNNENRISFDFKDKKNINITNISNIILNENQVKKILDKNEPKINYIKKIVIPMNNNNNKKSKENENIYNNNSVIDNDLSKQEPTTKIFINVIKNKELKSSQTNNSSYFYNKKITKYFIKKNNEKIKEISNYNDNISKKNQGKNMSMSVEIKDYNRNPNARESLKYLVHQAHEIKELAESFNKYYSSEVGSSRSQYKKNTYDPETDKYYADYKSKRDVSCDNKKIINDEKNDTSLINLYNNFHQNRRQRNRSVTNELFENRQTNEDNNKEKIFFSSDKYVLNNKNNNSIVNNFINNCNKNIIKNKNDFSDNSFIVDDNNYKNKSLINFYKINNANYRYSNEKISFNKDSQNDISFSTINNKNTSLSCSTSEPDIFKYNNKILNKNKIDNNYITLDNLYNLEIKLKKILSKITNYEKCSLESYDYIFYYNNIHFYEKEINMFKSIKNRKNVTEIIKKEIINFFLCYNLCFDHKNFTKVTVLLKEILNLLHNNFLLLIDFNLYNNPKYMNILKSNLITNDNFLYEKLKNMIIKELKKINITKNESDLIYFIKENFKEINKYYKMIIENFYSYNKNERNIIDFQFPNCLKIIYNRKNKPTIIRYFFNEAVDYRTINSYSLDNLFNFFDIYLNNNINNDNNDITINKNNTITNFNNNKLTIKKNNSSNKCFNIINSNNKYYLPPIKKFYKYTLVLDLDETLIYYRKDMKNNTKNISNPNKNTLIMRPGLIEFLRKMRLLYELVLFSFGTCEYVDNIVNIIEKKEKFFEHILYRNHATFSNNAYIKNLSLLGRDLKTILIVDDIPTVFTIHKSNGICIKPFNGDVVSDRNTLKILGEILQKIRFDADECGDIRKSLEKYKNFIMNHISNHLEN